MEYSFYPQFGPNRSWNSRPSGRKWNILSIIILVPIVVEWEKTYWAMGLWDRDESDKLSRDIHMGVVNDASELYRGIWRSTREWGNYSLALHVIAWFSTGIKPKHHIWGWGLPKHLQSKSDPKRLQDWAKPWSKQPYNCRKWPLWEPLLGHEFAVLVSLMRVVVIANTWSNWKDISNIRSMW